MKPATSMNTTRRNQERTPASLLLGSARGLPRSVQRGLRWPAVPVPLTRAELPAAVEEFLSWLAVERGRSANTLAAYRRDLAAYVEFLNGRGVSIDAVSERLVQDYIAYLRAGQKAPASVARALVAVRSLHRFLVDEGALAVDPTDRVDAPTVPAGLPKALSEDDIDRLLGAVVGDGAIERRDRAILETLYAGGLRISELVGLSLGDVDLDEGVLRARRQGREGARGADRPAGAPRRSARG